MLSEKELATALAALRFFQANFNDIAEMKEEMPLQFENVVPLNHQEIDELCEQLNTEAYFIISHLSYFHRENTKAPASDSNRLSNEKMKQITDQIVDTFLDFSDQKSEAVVDIDATNLLQRKNLLVEINERNGEKEYTFRCLAQCSCDQNPMFVADAIALNWYEDCLDEDPYDRDSFWFESGAIAVEVAGVKELPAQHYDVLNLYLSDLTPVDTDIAKAIAYKSAAFGYQGRTKMSRPQLNPKQRRWLSKFLSEYPWYKLREIRPGLDSDRIVVLEGTEQLPLPIVPEFAGALPGYRLHTLEVKLRKYGDPRKTAEQTKTTVYPHCDIEGKLRNTNPVGQLSLPIPAAVLEVPQARNPVVVTWKPKQKVQPKQGTQLSLPVTGLEAKVFRLRQKKRPHLPPVSSQELLAEKVSTWSKRDRTEVELPQVLVDLLLAHNADDEECQSAIDLFGVVGLPGAILYVDGIPYLRECKGLPVSTAAASAAVVPSQSWSKATTVTVKAFN